MSEICVANFLAKSTGHVCCGIPINRYCNRVFIASICSVPEIASFPLLCYNSVCLHVIT